MQTNFRVSDNFFPVDSSIYIKENVTNGRQLTIVTDRAEGGASLTDGEIQLMVHRRLLYDDNRGVGEPLNETGVSGLGLVVTGLIGTAFKFINICTCIIVLFYTSGTQRVLLDTVDNSPLLHRWNTRRLTFAPLLSFTPLTMSPQEYIASNNVLYSALTRPVIIELLFATSSVLSGGDLTHYCM
jgi:hypothetical protein